MNNQYDVIIVGGGPSGLIAAIAAGRTGARTLLIDKNGFLGGMATAAVLGPISPFHFGDEQVVKGIPQDFVDRLVKENGSTGHMKALDPYGSGDYLCFYDREKYKYVAAEMVLEAKVEILYHSFICGTLKEGDRVTGVQTASKSGMREHYAKIVVDATGDGDVAVLGGAAYITGDVKTGKMQPSSAMFEMANVDSDALYQYIVDNPDEFEWKSDIIPMREFSDRFKQRYFVAQGFNSLVKKGIASGELKFGRDTILLLNGIHPNTIHFNSTRVGGLDETDVEQRSRGEIDGRRQIESVSEYCIKHVPGFEHSFVSTTNSELGVRETRHVTGNYVLTGEDVVNGRKFDDVIARGYFPIDIHNPDGAAGYAGLGKGGAWIPLKDSFDIPYRCLVPEKLDGVVLTGRCISGTSEAHGSYRTQGAMMGLGHASGTAAALCALKGVQPRDLSVELLQKTLVEQGAAIFRNEDVRQKEKEHAHQRVAEFLRDGQAKITNIAQALK